MSKYVNWEYYSDNNTSTKGIGNLYGNTAGKPTEHINYAYAKRFNPQKLASHFYDHGEEVDANTMNEYEEFALAFANDVDRITNESFIDEKGSTYKYNSHTNEFAIIKKDGTVITYFKPNRGSDYFDHQRRKNGK